MHRPGQERQLPIAGGAAKSVTQDLGPGATRHGSCSGRMRGRIAACTDKLLGSANPLLLSLRAVTSRHPLAGVVVCADGLTGVAFVVKTGETAVILDRR
jgi:hypothetical protein